MTPALVLGVGAITYGLIADNPAEVYIGLVLIGLAVLVLVEENERRLLRRKRTASDHLNALNRLRVGYEDEERAA